MLTATLIHLRSRGEEMRRRLKDNGYVQIELDFGPTDEDLSLWPARRSRG